MEEWFILSKLAEDSACVECFVQVILVVFRKVINERVYHHSAFFSENLLHALLIGSQLRLCGLFDVKIAIVWGIPLVLFLWLDLLLDQLDHESGQWMLVDVSQETVENTALLMQKQILQSHLLLLVQQLLHHLDEVSTKDGQKFFLFIEAGCDLVQKRVVFFGQGFLSDLSLEFASC